VQSAADVFPRCEVDLAALAIVFSLFLLQDVVIRGQVLDGRTREPIAKALVSVRDLKLEAVTDQNGRFEMSGLPAGEIELYVTTVGYGLIKRKIEVQSGVETEIEFSLARRRPDFSRKSW
jgi:hypothetical protein